MTVLIGFSLPTALLAFRVGAAVISYSTENVPSVARAAAARATARKNVFQIMEEISLAASHVAWFIKKWLGILGILWRSENRPCPWGSGGGETHCYTSFGT